MIKLGQGCMGAKWEGQGAGGTEGKGLHARHMTQQQDPSQLKRETGGCLICLFYFML